MERQERRREIITEKRKSGSLFVPAGILIGIGVGFLVNNVPAGTLIGLGAGFAVWAILAVVKK
jgi:hypothetical protein